jgi:hypothetical protein
MTIDPQPKSQLSTCAAVKMFGYTPTTAIGYDRQKLLIEGDELTQKLNIPIPGTALKFTDIG